MKKKIDILLLILWLFTGIFGIVTHTVSEFTYGCAIVMIVLQYLDDILKG